MRNTFNHQLIKLLVAVFLIPVVTLGKHALVKKIVKKPAESKASVSKKDLDPDNMELKKFLDYVRSEKPKSKSEFASLLPDQCKKYYTPVIDSRATPCASPENPRLIVWCSEGTTKFNLAIDGEPGEDPDPRCQKAEILFTDDTGQSEAAEIQFNPEWIEPKIHNNPPRCFACHSANLKRIADDYPLWPGFLQSVQKVIKKDSPEGKAYQKLKAKQARKDTLYSHFIPYTERPPDIGDKDEFFSLRLGRTKEDEKEDGWLPTPVSVFFNKLNATHNLQSAAYIFRHPKFDLFKYVLAAAAIECPQSH